MKQPAPPPGMLWEWPSPARDDVMLFPSLPQVDNKVLKPACFITPSMKELHFLPGAFLGLSAHSVSLLKTSGVLGFLVWVKQPKITLQSPEVTAQQFKPHPHRWDTRSPLRTPQGSFADPAGGHGATAALGLRRAGCFYRWLTRQSWPKS